MTFFRKMLLAIVLAFGLAAQPAMAGKGPVKVSKGSDAAGTQQVVIGQFTLGVMVERKDTSKARGGIFGGGSGGKSTGLGTLQGYDPAQFQVVADAAYADLVKQLEASGFTVLDRANLAAMEDYQKLAPVDSTKEVTVKSLVAEKAKVLFYGADGTGAARIMPGDYPAGGFGGFGSAMSGYKATAAINEYVKSTGVRVVNVIYYLDFAEVEKRRSMSTSSIGMQGVLAVAENGSKLTLFTGKNTPTTITLNEPVGVEGDFFAQENAMGDGEKVARGAMKALNVLGGMGWNGMKKRNFIPQEGAYPEGATDAAIAANTVLVGELAALR